ncbi:MAG TPA: carboxypeptidase regulatory-like domain-containing protein [Bryobacteraceae bacterium]
MKRTSVVLLIIGAVCIGLFAQSVSQITGTVRDSSGLAVPGADVTVTQTDTGISRTAQTGTSGDYSLPALPIGPYRMEVKKEGFSTFVQTGIVLQVDTAPTIDPVLKVGAVTEQVNVQAEAAMVDTHTTGVGQVVNQQQVVDLPLNGRQVTQLITVAGGAVPVLGAYGSIPTAGLLVSTKNYPNETLVSVSGGQLNGTTYLMDGGSYNDPFNNLNLPTPFPDAIQEFKVETSALPAQYGQHAGGAINLVTKSGSNEIHGDAFEFVRNGDFNARDFFAPVGDNLKRNQFGGTLGGPVRKNKLFFFLGYQATIQRSAPAAAFANVPTPAMLTGNLQAYEANCFATPQTLKAPYVNNILPPSLISPQAVKMSSYFPSGPGNCGLTTYAQIANLTENMGLARLDYQLTSKQSIFARYLVTHVLVPSTFAGTELSVQLAGNNDEVNSLVLGHTYVLGSGALNTFRATLNRSIVNKFQVPILNAPGIGVQGVYQPLPNYSNITVSGDFASAGGTATPGFDATTTYQFSDDFSLVRGSHQIQFGANYIRPGQNSWFCVFCDGGFTFSSQATGSAFGDFFAGILDSFSQASITHDNERWNYFGIYAQDTWKITPRLTANYGLRWEPYLAGSFEYGWVTHFSQADFDANVHSTVYPNAPAGLLFPGDAGFNTGKRPNYTTWADFAPRFGLAWDPKGDGRMTVRGSWGIFYDMPTTLFFYSYAGDGPWGESITYPNSPDPGGFGNPWAAYPGGSPYPVTLSPRFVFPTGGSYLTVPLHVRNTYLEQTNVSVQKQLGASWVVKGNYLGNDTVHLWTDQELNPIVYIPGPCSAGQYGLTAAGPCSSTANYSARRTLTLQNPAQGAFYAGIEQLNDGGTASYNSMLLSVEHRLSSHFMVLVNYTWAHCISDNVALQAGGPTWTNPYNRRSDRGNCSGGVSGGGTDIRQNFNLTAVLQSPRFSSRPLRWVAGDWQLSPIFAARTGNDFTVTTGVDNSLINSGSQRPNQVTGDVYCAHQTINCWMSAAAFASPATGTLGNMGISALRGPGYFDVDVALSRRFRVRERYNLDIRAEAFNIQNRVNFLNPTAALNSSNFGKIQTDIAPRILQFATKFVF